MAEPNEDWKELRIVDDIYYKVEHVRCSTQVLILMGHENVCPRCEPEKWQAVKKKVSDAQ